MNRKYFHVLFEDEIRTIKTTICNEFTIFELKLILSNLLDEQHSFMKTAREISFHSFPENEKKVIEYNLSENQRIKVFYIHSLYLPFSLEAFSGNFYHNFLSVTCIVCKGKKKIECCVILLREFYFFKINYTKK